MHDQCIFIKELSNNRKVILVKYVDDIIITGNDASLIESVLDGFEKSFTKMTRDEDVKRYVGIDIDYDRVNGNIRLSQKPFIQRLLQKIQHHSSINSGQQLIPHTNQSSS